MTEMFWMFLVTSGCAAILALARIAYKSKCKEIKLCGGCINVKRDTEIERQEMEFTTVNHTNVGDSSKTDKSVLPVMLP